MLDGQITSLDPIEHVWLRKKKEYADPRIHAAVNCASISCPRLWHEAFIASKLDTQLDEASKAWLLDKSKNEFKPGKAKVSKIFDWFTEDFGGNEKGILAFIERYSPENRKLLGLILPSAIKAMIGASILPHRALDKPLDPIASF